MSTNDDLRISRIEDKLDKANDHLASIDVTLASQAGSLSEHMRRTVALEALVPTLKEKLDMATGVIKLLSTLAIILSVMNGIAMFAKSIH